MNTKIIVFFKKKSIRIFLLLYFVFATSWIFFEFNKIDIFILLIGSIYCITLYKKEDR